MRENSDGSANVGCNSTSSDNRENSYCNSVEGNLIVNKCELQYYGYSIAVMSALLLALMHVSNLVVTLVCFVCCAYGIPYVDINKFSSDSSVNFSLAMTMKSNNNI